MPTHQKSKPLSQVQIGDWVWVDSDLDWVIGVRYGQIAYDVTLEDAVCRNVAPERVRLASPAAGERHAANTRTDRQLGHFLDGLRAARTRVFTQQTQANPDG
jgi:hypothetical protein